nr:hypothetical protein [Tanacetum cinerariifolium]
MGHGSGHGLAHGSAHGSTPVHDDEDESPVAEVSPVKPKKPSRHATLDQNDEAKELPNEWTVEEEIALCQGWCDVSENNISGNSMKAKGLWEAVIRVRPRIGIFYAIIKNIEANHESGTNDLDVYHKVCAEYKMIYKGDFMLEHWYNILKDHPGWKDVEMPYFTKLRGEKSLRLLKPLRGQHLVVAKKKAAGSSHGGYSSFVDLVADKFYIMKQKIGKEGRATTVLYRVEESRVEYLRGRGLRNCTAEKKETRNSESNA